MNRVSSFFARLAPFAVVAAIPVVAWAAVPGTCSTAPAAATMVFGSSNQAFNTLTSPSATYGGKGCDGHFVADWTGTGGKKFDVAARYADAPLTSQSACTSAKVTAVAWGFRNNAWEIIGPEKTASGTWSGTSCTSPVASLTRITDSTFSKVRVVARATGYKGGAAKVSGELKDRSYPD